MAALQFRPAALADIDDIWNYTVQEWGATQADRYNQLIQSACLGLADESYTGVSVEHIRTGYFKYQVGRHTIYYRQLETAIAIERILHQRMNVPDHLG